MMKKHWLGSFTWMFVAVSLLAGSTLAGAQAKPAAAAGPKAGNISALLPVAKITRGSGQSKSVTTANKGDEVVWNDLIQTEKGGRARILLNDQSVISLGSQAELRIIKHDNRSQQTAMQLTYGRVRLQVSTITRDAGRFELRTPTAVAGVIGTEFGTDSSLPGVTDFICISGMVTVANEDSKVGGSVQCPAGSTTTVNKGLPPTAPKPATQQQIRQLIQDTEPAVISSFSPASAILGTEVVSAVTGSKMLGINAVNISGEGVNVALEGTPTETTTNVKVVVSAGAAPGTRTISFTKANGQTTSAVFSILAPPNAGTTVDYAALKKAYLELIDEERQSAISGVNAIGINVQQSADVTAQTIQAENGKLAPPLDPAKIESDLKADASPVLQGMNAAGASINEESAKAGRDLDAAINAVEKNLSAQQPAATEEAKAKAAKDAFDRINALLLQKFSSIQENLAAAAKSADTRFQATNQRWMEAVKLEAVKQKAVPLPKVDADERSYDVGLMATFDGSRSTGAAGSAITGYSWVLCDPGYKPQQVGIPLPASDTRCRPVAGYAGTSPEFKFQTCMLNPQDYIARLTIVDASNKSASMDVRVRVLPAQYDEPGGRLRGLADAYQQLQPNAFTTFFDESYSGLTELQESIRRTFSGLASMNINLRLSQASLGCNEATVRADWDQNYTFKEDQTCVGAPLGSNCQRVVFRQAEQLTVRMKRIPGKNWYITDFQGDNGTVQGVPPGPIQRDTALPDFRISNLNALGGTTSTTTSAVGITPGPNSFTAIVENIGTAASQGTVRVRFAANDANGTEIASDIRDFTGSLAAGGSTAITGILNIPDLGPTANARIFANVNPSCTLTEKNCDGANATLLDVIVGNVDIAVVSAAQVGTLVGTQAGQMSVVVTNSGSRTSAPTFGNLRVLSGTIPIGSANIPALAPGASTTITVPIIAPNLAGTQPVTVAISPASVADLNPANDSIAATLTLTQAVVDVQFTGLAFSGPAPPYLSGQTVTVIGNLTNAGNRPTNSVLFVCRLTGTPGTTNFFQQSIPVMAAGATITGYTYSFVVPANFSGTNTLTCGATQDAFETNIANNELPLTMAVSVNVDLQVVNLPAANTPFQMGSTTAAYNFNIQNFGGDTVAPGWNVVFLVNGNPVGTFTSVAPLAGFSSLPVSITFTVPQPAPAPADMSGITATVHVNSNSAATETNTANNIANTTVRLVDFELQALVPASPLTSVTGRTFTGTGIQVNPPTYPLPITLNYTGLPGGLAGTGTNGTTLAGTTSAAAGGYTVSTSGTVAGVTHSAAGTFGIQVLDEISITPGTPPSLTAASGGGPVQPAQVTIAGGIYPLGLAFVQPTGIAMSGPTTLGAAGIASYNLSADPTATSGAQSFVLTVTDPGNANTPGKVVTANIPYSVIGFTDFAIQPFVLTPAGPYVSGQSISVPLIINNLGNASTSASNTYSCQHNGTPGVAAITSGAVPVIAPNSSVTIPINFVMPANRSPLSIFECTVTQDTQESGGSLTDNFRSLNLTVNQNIDLEVISISAPGPYQMGGSAVANITVRNNGLDTASGGWDVGVKINGSVVGTPGIGSPLAGGASVSFNPTIPIPQIGTAPTNSGSYSLAGFVNANAAVAETTTANNLLAGTTNLVDFQLVQVSTGGTIVVGRPMSITPVVQLNPPTYPLATTVNFVGLPAGLAGSGSPYGQDITGTPTTPGPSSVITASATVSGVTRAMPGSIGFVANNEINLALATTFNPLTSGGTPESLQVNVSGGIYPVTLTLPPLPTGITTSSPTTVVLAAPGVATWNLQAGLTSSPGAFNVLIAASDGGNLSTGTPVGSASLNVLGSVTGQSNYILTAASLAFPHSTGTGNDSLQVGETVTVNFTAQNTGNLTQAGTLTVTLATACGTGPFTGTASAPSAGGSVSGTVTLPVSCAPAAYSYALTITSAPAETSTSDNSIGPFNFQVFDFDVLNTSGLSPQNIRMGSTGTYNLSLPQTGPASPLSLPLTITNGGKASTSPTGTTSSLGGATTVSVTNSGAAVTGDTENVHAFITRLGVTKSAIQTVKFYTAQIDNISSGQPGSTASNPIVLAIGAGSISVDMKLIGTFAGSATFVMPVATGYNISLAAGAPSLPNDIFTLTFTAITGAPATVTAVPVVFNIPNTNPAQTVSTTIFVRAFAPSNIAVGTPVGSGTRFASRNFSTYPLLSGEVGELSIPVSNTGLGASTAGLGIRVRLGSSSGPVINAVSATVPSVPAGSTTNVVIPVIAPDPIATGGSAFYVEVDQDPIEFDASNNNNSLPINTSDWTLTITGLGNATTPLQIDAPTPGSANTSVTVAAVAGSIFAPIDFNASGGAKSISIAAPTALQGPANITVAVGTIHEGGEFTATLSATMLNGGTVTALRTANLFVLVNVAPDPSFGAKSETTMPDVQIKASETSLSPSIPRAGDTVDVRFKITNTGNGDAVAVPVALQVNGKIVATETYDLKAGASTLGGFQYALPGARNLDADSQRALTFKQRSNLDAEEAQPVNAPNTGLAIQLIVDPAGTVAQKSTSNKSVALTKAALTASTATMTPAERVYLEMSTLCAGFRPSSGVVSDCDGGAELDIAIEDFANSRFSLTALYGVADLGTIDIAAASTNGVRFDSRAMLTLGHTYAVQLSGNRVGFVKFSASLTPRQLEAEARKRFGAMAIRILRKLGTDTGATQVGDVSGKMSADALMYFDMSFRLQQ